MLHLDPTDTNQLANCEQATRVFARVWEEAPTNRLAIPALLEKAKCYKDWALVRQQFDSLTNALNVYEQVLRSPQADVPARSEAKVGLAITLEKWADHKSGKERTALLEQALSNCVDVVYGTILRDNERPHEWWTKKAGDKGLELADTLQAWSQEVRLFQRLTNSVWPQLPEPLVRQVKRAQENLDREKANN